MARVKATISVSIERAVHQALMETAQRVWDEHKIKLDHVHFDWFDQLSVDGLYCIVNSVSVDSQSFASERPVEPDE